MEERMTTTRRPARPRSASVTAETDAAPAAAPVRARRPLTWPAFEKRLAKALAAMAPETFLILTTPVAGDAPVYYVQFAHATDLFRAEAVGSANLPPSRPLDDGQLERIRGLGWRAPEGDGERNAIREWPVPAPVEEVALLAVETMRSVYGIDAPAALRFKYAAFAGPTPPLPSLGIARDVPPPHPAESKLKAGGSKGIGRLRRQVEKALAGWIGVPKVFADDDGDYPIRTGSAICYLRILDGVPPAISVFSPVLRDVAVTADLLSAIDDINGKTRYGRVFTSGPAVLVALELPAIDLTPAHVAFACQEVGALADFLDDMLHGRFGGRITFDTSPKLLN
jgi:hypothetical protein